MVASQPSCRLTPVKPGRMPTASVAADPRLTWRASWVNWPVLAPLPTCAQPSRPPVAADAGLVAVQHRRPPQRGLDRRLHPLAHARCPVRTQPTTEPRASRTPKRSASSGMGASEGHQLRLHQLNRSRPQPRPVVGWLGASGGNVPTVIA